MQVDRLRRKLTRVQEDRQSLRTQLSETNTTIDTLQLSLTTNSNAFNEERLRLEHWIGLFLFGFRSRYAAELTGQNAWYKEQAMLVADALKSIMLNPLIQDPLRTPNSN